MRHFVEPSTLHVEFHLLYDYPLKICHKITKKCLIFKQVYAIENRKGECYFQGPLKLREEIL